MPSDPLRAAGLRRTPARVAVLERIDALSRPVSHAELQAEIEDIDAITLYRTLATLVDVGLVHRIHGIDAVWRYCPQPRHDGCPGNHAHFLCTTCASMTCLVDQPMPHVKVPRGARVHGRHFVVHGSCRRCRSLGESE